MSRLVTVIALPGDYSFPGHYAAYIERDLGVAVTLHTFTKPEDVTEQILDLVRTNERWRDALSEAEIVTLATGHMDIQSVIYNEYSSMNGECGGEDGLDCVRAELAALESDYNAIYAGLFALCSPGTLIRTETYPYASLRGLGYDGDVRPFVEPLNELIIRVAAAHNVPVARVDLAFNGPDGGGGSGNQGVYDRLAADDQARRGADRRTPSRPGLRTHGAIAVRTRRVPHAWPTRNRAVPLPP